MILQELISNPVVQSIIGGGTFGAAFYARVRYRGDEITPFEPYNFATTVGLSAALGAGLWAVGMVPTFESIGWLLVAFAGAVGLTEASLKALIRGEHHLAKQYGYAAVTSALYSLLQLGRTSSEVRESIEAGEASMDGKTDADLQSEWDGAYPDEETYSSVDDPPDEETLAEIDDPEMRRRLRGDTVYGDSPEDEEGTELDPA